jgi:dTDP-4-amino-4,6-dideoxygalactose transaminase
MSPTKTVTSGEGGMIVTKDKDLAEKLRILRNYGTEVNYEQFNPGLNARMSEFHAIVGLESLSRFWVNFSHRISLVEHYLEHFDADQVQKTTPNGGHAWKDFSVLLGTDRDALRDALTAKGIESKSYFRPISSLESYKGTISATKHSYEVNRQILQLPLPGNMSLQDVERVCEILGAKE